MGRQKLLVFMILVVSVVGITACSSETAVEEEPVTSVAVLPASRGRVLQQELVSGVARPQEEVYIIPQLGGEIRAVEVQTGDRVEKGQVLVHLEDTDMMLQVQQAEAGLEAAQAQLDRAVAGASEEDLSRLDATVAQAEVGVEAALLNLYAVLDEFSPVHQQLQGAQAQYRQAQIAREQAENQLYQVMYGSAIEKADLAVDQAREAKALAEDSIDELEKAIKGLDALIAAKEAQDEDTTELRAEREKLNSSLAATEAEYEMTKYQVDQAKVARDQVLIETREQAELALRQAEEAEDAARAQVQMLRKTANQQESLALGQKKQAEASLEAAKAGMEQARKGAREEDLQATEAGVKQARAAVALARSQLDKGTIQAPISGVATAVEAQVGGMAGPGSPLLSIVNSQLIKVEFNLTERLINSVAPGDEVGVRFISLPEREFRGVVTAVSPAADPRTGVFPVEATLENDEGLLKPGLFADVDLIVGASEGNLVIPREAVLQEGDQEYVFVVQKGRARKQAVSLGIANGEEVEVLSGLLETDFLVVKGQHYLEEGGMVSIGEWLGGEGR